MTVKRIYSQSDCSFRHRAHTQTPSHHHPCARSPTPKHIYTRCNPATRTAVMSSPHSPRVFEHQHNLQERYRYFSFVIRPSAGARATAPLSPMSFAGTTRTQTHTPLHQGGIGVKLGSDSVSGSGVATGSRFGLGFEGW